MCKKWYDQVANGEIKSNNFQLHPPIGKDSNVSTNKCGNLSYPLLMCAEYIDDGFVSVQYEPEVMKSGECSVSA
jgi:hypothetical protein